MARTARKRPAPRRQTTMRMRADIIAALDAEAERQSRVHRVPLSRSRLIENILVDYCNAQRQGYRLKENPAPAEEHPDPME